MIVQFLSLDCVATNFMTNLCFCLFPICHTALYGAIPAYAICILPLTIQRSYNMVLSMINRGLFDSIAICQSVALLRIQLHL
jgi:hypothetical protein